MPSDPVTSIGKYKVSEIIGQGGMGVVYKAVDPQIGRVVAIKKMGPALTADSEHLERFYREAQAAGNLQHPNIVTIYDLGEENGAPYLVMEYVAGDSLEKLLSAPERLTLDRVLDITIQVCDGLRCAHQRGIVHRDVKPANVLVPVEGPVKLLDFGIARISDHSLTRTGQIMGTLNYVSPEQLQGETVDGRSDIFATGVMLFEMLTKNLPFQAEDAAGMLAKVASSSVPSLSSYLTKCPAELDGIIQRALARDKNQRYQSADEFAFELSRVKEKLDRETIADSIDRARAYIQSSDLKSAKKLLSEALRIDSQDHIAKQLLNEVQEILQRRNEELRDTNARARSALGQRRFSQALSCVDEALKISASDTEANELLKAIETAKARSDEADRLVLTANEFRASGSLQQANAAVRNALTIDPSHGAAIDLKIVIGRELAREAEHQKIRDLLAAARQDISLHNFAQAHDRIRQAEILDPTIPEIESVKDLAVREHKQQLRTTEIERAAFQIQNALSIQDFETACQRADLALEQFPNEAVLLRLKESAEESRQAQKRNICIARAEELLGDNEYDRAISWLQQAQAIPGTTDVEQLLTGARLQAESFRKTVQDVIDQAERLLVRNNFSAAAALVSAQPASFARVAEFANICERIRHGFQESSREAQPRLHTPEPKESSIEVPTPQPSAGVTSFLRPMGRFGSPGKSSTTNLQGATASAPAPAPEEITSPANVPGKITARTGSTSAFAISKANLWIVAAAVMVLVGVIISVAAFHKARATHAPVTQTFVQVDASPWGTVKRVVSSDKQVTEINETTPARLRLAPGDYTIILVSPAGIEQSVPLTVGKDGAVLHHRFEEVDVQKIVNSY